MINFNGNLIAKNINIYNPNNRGYKYGDALFETLKIVDNNILFWEDHYFRLMASMRILRMDIPMHFTMEFFEAEILKTLSANQLTNARVRLNIDRGEGGKYLPLQNTTINFSIVAEVIDNEIYTLSNSIYEVDLYKDFFVAEGLLSGLKTNNKIINTIGSIYAKENLLQNCLLLNTKKNVVEALNGNLFLVSGNTIKTPPLEDGCLRGIMRKQVLQMLLKDVNIIVEETSISPFELQKADELFITNVITGIQPITKYRKKNYRTNFAESLVAKLNAQIRLNK